jgi:Domain of unknown function DUF11
VPVRARAIGLAALLFAAPAAATGGDRPGAPHGEFSVQTASALVGPTPPAFGSVPPKNTVTKVATFTNTGTAPVTLGAATISGSPAFALGAVDTCSGAVLGAGGACGVQVAFAPTAVGSFSATLQIPSTDPATGVAVSLAARSVAAAPDLPFYSGNVPICHASGPRKYVSNAPNYASIVGGSGHGAHARDIIPAFRYPGGTYPGKNWNAAGIAAYVASGCGAAPGTGAPTITPPRPPVQETVTLCHATAPNRWESISVAADAAYTTHARLHPDDIVPPFSLATADGAIAFPGHGWDNTGRTVFGNGGCRPLPPARPPVSAERITFCGPAVSGHRARLSLEPGATVSFARQNPTSIVPPFDYNGGDSRFPGANWTAEGRAALARGCADPPPPRQPVTPVVECVQVSPDGNLTAYFGVNNGNSGTITIPVGPENSLAATAGVAVPAPPPAFAPGSATRVFTVSNIPASGAVTWSITSGGPAVRAVASAASPRCQVPETPAPDFGLFGSCAKAEGATYTAVFGYENRSSVPFTVDPVARNAVRVGTASSSLRGQPPTFAPGRTGSAFAVAGVPRGATATWTVVIGGITRTAVATADTPKCAAVPPPTTIVPALPTTLPQPEPIDSTRTLGLFVTCVRTNRDGTFDAVFGYNNPNAVTVEIPEGTANALSAGPGGSPDPLHGQVTTFTPGVTDRAWTATAVPHGRTLVWSVSFHGTVTATAGVASPACEAAPITEPPVLPELVTAPTKQRMGVFVQCVTVQGSKYSATFGYEMVGAGNVSIPVSAGNDLTPAPRFRGQPTQFTSGRHESAFTVSGIPLKKTVTWKVVGPDGALARATAQAANDHCHTEAPSVTPKLEIAVPSPGGPVFPQVTRTQEITVTNSGTQTGTGVIVTVPPTGQQTITTARGETGATCSVAEGRGILRVPALLPGQTARCRLQMRVDSCEQVALVVHASGTAVRPDGTTTPRSAGAGGPRSCRAEGLAVTG